jgi:hypothetical protein
MCIQIGLDGRINRRVLLPHPIANTTGRRCGAREKGLHNHLLLYFNIHDCLPLKILMMKQLDK